MASREQKKMERKQRKSKVRAAQYAASAARKNQKGHKVAVKRPVKINGYSFAKKNAKLNIKRNEAISRQNQWAELTVTEQINELKNRPGESKRQITRLENLTK